MFNPPPWSDREEGMDIKDVVFRRSRARLAQKETIEEEMVEVTRLNGQNVILNGDLIELIEAKPDTIVSLTTGRKIIVREAVDELIQKIFDYRRMLLADPLSHNDVLPRKEYHPSLAEVI